MERVWHGGGKEHRGHGREAVNSGEGMAGRG